MLVKSALPGRADISKIAESGELSKSVLPGWG
jgi:hypothetical protein